MKRLILPAVVAFLIHAALLSFHYKPLWSGPYEKPEIKFMTLTASISASKSEKVETVKEVEKRVEKPEKKKELVKPVAEAAPVDELREEEKIDDSPEEKRTETSDSESVEKPVKESKAQAEVKQAVPLYSSNPPPPYPRAARARGFQGMVVLEVLVRADGMVGDVRILQPSGYGILDRAALSSVRKWIFKPGSLGGTNLETWVKVPIRFQLE